VASAQQRLQSLLGVPQSPQTVGANPADVEVLTREVVNQREKQRWVHETPLGQIFNLGVWVALLVGVAIVYQVLSSDIANMIREYATLKAMGYSNAYLTSVVLTQSVLLAIVGYLPSLAAAWGLYALVEYLSGMPMELTLKIAAMVAVLTVAMCMLSGIAALRKLYQADPADLF
jgi:putative ABC transport system permease protein